MTASQEASIARPPVQAVTLKYRPIAELGRGGMATVYLTVVQGVGGFNKLQVVKRLRPALAEDPEFLSMFLEEARLAARINHPNVVQTNEVGFDGQNYFIAMEYLDGQSLESVVRRSEKEENTFPLTMHLLVLAETLGALHFAHELKNFDGSALRVVHRDVSPHNIIVTYDGHVKLVDFGIAKAADSSTDTRTGIMKGKCAYMAPEQFGGIAVDRRADIFAVGVMLWQALTGTRLWKGLSDAEIFQRLATGQIDSPRKIKPEIPERLDAICMKALSTEKEKRHATAAEFQSELEEYMSTLPRIAARDVGKHLSDLFKDRREMMKAAVEEQIKALSNAGDVALLSFDPAAAHSNPDVGSDDAVQAFLSERKPKARKKRALLLGGLGAAAVVILFTTLSRRNETHPVVAEPSTATTTTNAAPLASTTLKIRTTPVVARIFLDGRFLGPSANFTSLPRDGVNHQLRAEADGYLPKTIVVAFDSSVVLVEIALDKENVVAEAAAGAAAKGRTWAGAPRVIPRSKEPAAAQVHVDPPATAAAPVTEPAVAAPPPDDLHRRKIRIDTDADPWAPKESR